jgi:hypothetical protein
MPRVNTLLDPEGNIRDPEVLTRLEAQAAGFIDFVERLKPAAVRS